MGFSSAKKCINQKPTLICMVLIFGFEFQYPFYYQLSKQIFQRAVDQNYYQMCAILEKFAVFGQGYLSNYF